MIVIGFIRLALQEGVIICHVQHSVLGLLVTLINYANGSSMVDKVSSHLVSILINSGRKLHDVDHLNILLKNIDFGSENRKKLFNRGVA